MSETNNGSDREMNDNRPSIQERISSAFQIEDRDWNKVSRRVATRSLAIGGAGLALLATGVTGFRAAYASKIYPNISIGDVNVGGMTAEEAREAVQARVDEFNANAVSFTYEDLSWTPTLEELGVRVDVDALIDQAMDLGRDEKAADRLLYTSTIASGGEIIPLQYKLQTQLLEDWFEKVDADIDDPPIDATFQVEGASLQITADETGTGADREAVESRLFEAMQTLQPFEEKLPTAVAEPQITKAGLEENEAEVLNILSNSVTIRFEDKQWELKPEEVSSFMIFTSTFDDGEITTEVDFDRQPLGQFLREKFSPEVDRLPVNSNVQFFEGKLTATSESVDGKLIKASEFADLVAESFQSDHARVDIPVATTRPKVHEDNLDELGIKERLVRVDSNFTTDIGTARETNVMVGIRLLNNTVVAPGDDFSFNGAIGSIDANPDFAGGSAIVGGVIQDEFGGGICQVTTTAFRAGIFGGFPITEWYPHTYRLSGYERDGWGPGFDASILQPEWQTADEWPDFKFTNNTEHFILVSSWAEGGYHIVEIYGTSDGRDVQISETSTWEAAPAEENRWAIDWDAGPGTNFVSAYPIDGLNASFTRTVHDADGNEMYTREFVSPYKARGWQCTCSADMEGQPCW